MELSFAKRNKTNPYHDNISYCYMAAELDFYFLFADFHPLLPTKIKILIYFHSTFLLCDDPSIWLL